MFRKTLQLSGLLLCLSLGTATSAPLSVTNPGFESGTTDWTVVEKEGIVVATSADAGRDGSTGLHVEDNSDSQSAKVMSKAVAVEPGKAYRIGFWARTSTPGRIGVFMRFCTSTFQTIDPENLVHRNIDGSGSDWQNYTVEGRAPQQAAFLMIWIHSYSKLTGSVDFDDFSIEESDGASLAAATPSAGTVAKNQKAMMTTRSSPAKIIIKADDLRSRRGAIDPRWMRFIDFIKERKIKASIGVIGESLDGDFPEYFNAVKELHATGLFEFWNHGYDHREWKEGGKRMLEFQGSTYEYQKQHLTRTNQLAREKLGFPLVTFGASFAVHDQNTVRALQEDPDIKIWLYGKPVKSDDPAAGKIVLDRRWDVTIEQPLFVPNSQKFIEGFTKHPDVDYFVIQGHPWRWDDAGFAEFTKIVEYALQNGAEFVTPSELCGISLPGQTAPAAQ